MYIDRSLCFFRILILESGMKTFITCVIFYLQTWVCVLLLNFPFGKFCFKTFFGWPYCTSVSSSLDFIGFVMYTLRYLFSWISLQCLIEFRFLLSSLGIQYTFPDADTQCDPPHTWSSDFKTGGVNNGQVKNNQQSLIVLFEKCVLCVKLQVWICLIIIIIWTVRKKELLWTFATTVLVLIPALTLSFCLLLLRNGRVWRSGCKFLQIHLLGTRHSALEHRPFPFTPVSHLCNNTMHIYHNKFNKKPLSSLLETNIQSSYPLPRCYTVVFLSLRVSEKWI